MTLALSQHVLPEQLYPWLTLAAGLLVVGIGLAVLRSRGKALRGPHHRHGHPHAHSHGHDDGHHHAPADLSWRGVFGMGASAGLIPCPSALVVLLGAISQREVGLGMLLVTAFSLGLAATLTALGLLVVYASRITRRLDGRISDRLVGALPAASAAIIVGVGTLLTVRAIPQVLGA